MIRFFAIIVLYNRNFFDTVIYKTVISKNLNNSCISFLVYDNSLSPQTQPDEISAIGGSYFHDKDNSGVSAAYNKGAELATQIGDIDFLLLLDQDTLFEDDYLEKIQLAVIQNPNCNLFAPSIIYGKNKPFSPVKMSVRGVKGVNLEPGEYNLRDYPPVNSGACIKLSVFIKIGGYNNKIRLDFADFDFFSRLEKISPLYRLINSYAVQSFSNEETDKNKLMQRFAFFIEGSKYAFKNTLIRKYVVISVLKHTLALTMRFKTFDYIRILIRSI